MRKFPIGFCDRNTVRKNVFDIVTMLHVGMNVEDKLFMMTELERVRKPAGKITIYDVTLTGTETINYPMPWATTEEFSFPEPASKYIEAAKASGLIFLKQVDYRKLAKKFFYFGTRRTATSDTRPPYGPKICVYER